jgi:adenine-specific DNA-methyltransferase
VEKKAKGSKATSKKVTRYTYENIKEPRTPETGHTSLLPADEQVVTMPMDNGWSKALKVSQLAQDDRPVVVDMNPVVDPVLMWAGKRSKREVPVLPLQRNEIVSESRIKQIIDRARKAAEDRSGASRQGQLYADLEKSLRERERTKRIEFYTHDEGWKNKLICGDSLHVMESLLRYENLRGKVQMIYIDPPYGIKYDANFQQRVDSTKNDETNSVDDVLTIKAFRDTWSLGIHSYLSYLQDRLYLCRELLSERGSVFVQINDQNLHVVRAVLDEVFGRSNFCSLINFSTVTSQSATLLPSVSDYLVWYAKSKPQVKFRKLYVSRDLTEEMRGEFKHYEMLDGSVHRVTPENVATPSTLPKKSRLFRSNSAVSGDFSKNLTVTIDFDGVQKHPGENRHWKTSVAGMLQLHKIGRLLLNNGPTRMFKQYLDDFPLIELVNNWGDLRGEQHRLYSTQTHETVVERCILMTTDAGDIVTDITCGSGTTAVCSERWARRWITCDTSRVAINVARQRLLGSVFEHFLTLNGSVSSGLKLRAYEKLSLETLAQQLEPQSIELVDQPESDNGAVRVVGPFEVDTLGRYSVEDWKGYVVSDDDTSAPKLENYIEVMCRLYRKDAAIQGATGLVHALLETEKEKIAISIGPLSGRVTAKQINDAVQDALASGILEIHILGWAFEANVGEMKSQLEKRGKVKVELLMIRPDTLAEGLKVTKPEMLFSPLALPDIEVSISENGDHLVTTVLKGIAVFDRKTRGTDYKSADSGYVSAWYLDEDYDGDCFVDCQMFFDFKKAPALKTTLKAEIDPKEFKLQTTSQPFQVGGYKRVAVKVVDIYGNESTVVKDVG